MDCNDILYTSFLKWLGAEETQKLPNGVYIKFKKPDRIRNLVEFETFLDIYIVEVINDFEAIFTFEAFETMVHNYKAPFMAREF